VVFSETFPINLNIYLIYRNFEEWYLQNVMYICMQTKREVREDGRALKPLGIDREGLHDEWSN